ncbi:hypothetical protein ILUMI_26816 [Ignelater luminosus]|uniref:Guanine nucleotide-binding protein-like 1 n=1 Tax=Ignelater luminosus TaxID=2038154 RepID=A0A8K0FYB0_IGNLU|nr:hypothetical protein ILUMI_26816 [Ignelater luminosus]
MPQGRRRTPFSGKAKKEQLKAKKHNKTTSQTERFKKPLLVHTSDEEDLTDLTQKVNYQAYKSGKVHSNRFALYFHRETDAEIRERKEIARQTLHPVTEKNLEINIDDYFAKELDFPQRPAWSYNETLANLEAKENKYFTEYLNNIEKQFDRKELSYFELNLETWRQLWRVLEMSDIVLVIVDIRFPALMFPPLLYEYVTQRLKKDMILVLNKVDLAPAEIVAAWKVYFKEKYPELHVLMFTTLPGYNLIGKQSDKAGLQVRRRRGKLRMAAEGAQLLLNTCKDIVGNAVDLSSWEEKIKEELMLEYAEDNNVEIEKVIDVKNDTGYFEHEKYKNGILTIGCIGQPNVGKSSLLNAIMGKKVVSVSRTPGHTKHFQTIFLTNNVRLCDCPGLVFPSKVPKTLQILMGSFPIAQLREPHTTVKYLAERLDLPKLLRIDHPDGDDQWSAMDVCDGWAKKRGFLTAKAARLDTFRAANNLLRMALDGKICLCLRPPEYASKKDFWKSHPDTETVRWIQARSTDEAVGDTNEYGDDEDFSEDDTKPTTSGDPGASVSIEGSDDGDDSDSSVERLTVAANKFAVLNDD